jgi:hypothetical protein
MQWFLPTFHGDISLVEREPGLTILKVTHVTPSERVALEILRKRALSRPWGSSPWATPEEFIPLDSPTYLEATGGVEVPLDAKLSTVRDFLAKQLKPTRKLVNAVVFKDGAIAEVAFTEPGEGPEPEPPAPAPAPPETTPKPSRSPRAGATVANPTQGCPPPDFEYAEIRAAIVLEHFLTQDQIRDFRTYNRFVSVGVDTGHRYMLTSRLRRNELRSYAGRSLFDLDEGRAYCVHDWTIPAAEELLSLHVLLSLPGRESYLRAIPDA